MPATQTDVIRTFLTGEGPMSARNLSVSICMDIASLYHGPARLLLAVRDGARVTVARARRGNRAYNAARNSVRQFATANPWNVARRLDWSATMPANISAFMSGGWAAETEARQAAAAPVVAPVERPEYYLTDGEMNRIALFFSNGQVPHVGADGVVSVTDGPGGWRMLNVQGRTLACAQMWPYRNDEYVGFRIIVSGRINPTELGGRSVRTFALARRFLEGRITTLGTAAIIDIERTPGAPTERWSPQWFNRAAHLCGWQTRQNPNGSGWDSDIQVSAPGPQLAAELQYNDGIN